MTGLPDAPALRFGIGLSQRHQPELAGRLDALGFDSLWVGGHLLWHTPMLEPLTQLTGYAAVTRRIQLGTSVLLLPLYHPVLLAKTLTTLDVISGGRVVLGVGVGGENPAEFEAMGVPLNQRGKRADEAIMLLRALWSGRSVDRQGRYFHVRNVKMSPSPTRMGGPPIWVAGRSPAALARVAARGDGWIGIFLAPARYREAVTQVKARCATTGRDPATITFAHYLWARVDDTREAAAAGARAYLERSYNRSFRAEQVPRFCAAGAPDDLRARVAEYAAAGCEHVIMKPACDAGHVAEQVERLAEVLLP